MSESLVDELVVTASTTLVGALATDAWQLAATGLRRLFRRDPDHLPVIEAQADANATHIARAADPNGTRAALVAVWRLELAQYLARYPDALEDLQALIDDVGPALDANQAAWAVQQVNIARDEATQNVAGRDQTIHYGTTPTKDGSRRDPEPRPRRRP
jgi:hypothetical protein